jgi:hypothetical protein
VGLLVIIAQKRDKYELPLEGPGGNIPRSSPVVLEETLEENAG